MKSATIGLSPSVTEWMMQAISRLTGTWAVVIGVAILIGGRQRFSGPSFTYALNLPGAPPSWGIWILIAGLLVVGASLSGNRVVIIVGLLACGAWALSFGTCSLLSLLNVTQAGFTGVPTYYFISILSGCLAAAYISPGKVRL